MGERWFMASTTHEYRAGSASADRPVEPAAMHQPTAPEPGTVIKRHRVSTRIWHWLNAVVLLVLLMSGLMIFNAHPRLYWGQDGANYDYAWFEIGARSDEGYLRLGSLEIETTGVLGRWTDGEGRVRNRAFPHWATIPSNYSLADGRRWHLAFAWLLAVPLLLYMVWSLANRHVQRDLHVSRREWSPRNIWHDIKEHAQLRFLSGAHALHYNVLQKLSYIGVIFVLLPLIILTGLTMSPNLNAGLTWTLDLLGGRQSARSIHFICTAALVAFFLVHVTMVLLAGPVNGIRSMITGRFRLPGDRDVDATDGAAPAPPGETA